MTNVYFYSSVPFPAFDGPLKENYKLSEAEHLFKGVLNGPESIVFHNGKFYSEFLL